MKVRRLGLLGVTLLLAACGGGGGGGDVSPTEEIRFDVPPQPPSLSDRSGLNQAPEARLMSTQIEPLIAKRPVPFTPDEEAAAERRARAGTGFLKIKGIEGESLEFEPSPVVLQDEFGGTHVKFAQSHLGVPILGAGLVSHMSPDRGEAISDNVIRGIDVDVRPTYPETAAIADAMGRFGTRGATPETTSRLVICPTLKLVKVRNDYPRDNTADYEEQLVDAKLAWEVTVALVVPSFSDLIQSKMRREQGGTDPDDAGTDAERRRNGRRGARDEDDTETSDAFVEAATVPAIRYTYDALSGALISEQALAAHNDFVPAEGVGHSYLSGTVPLSVSYYPDNDTYYLMDISRPDTGAGPLKIGNYVLDAQNLETHDSSQMDWVRDWNNIWGDGSIFNSEGSLQVSARRQTPAVDVAHGVQMTWDFYENVLSRWGPAGDGTRTRACVHYGNEYGDAHFSSSSEFICFGDGGSISNPGNYSLATVAHELGHAFWHAVGNGTGSNEARALNEGHADIQAGLVALYRGTGWGTGNQVRRFGNTGNWRGRVVNPDGYTEIDGGVTWTGQKYWSPAIPLMPEHVGGLPYGRAMIYLAEGAPSDPNSTLYTSEFPDGLGGIGITFAAHIWRFATAYMIVGTPTYSKVRKAYVDAASWLYGVDSMAVRAVRRAFAAIRVGPKDFDTQSPSFVYAHVFEVNEKDQTAAILAIPSDDTGFREMRVHGYKNNGVYKGDIFLGYASITRASVGTNSFSFTVEDSAGKLASVNRSFVKTRDRNLIVNGDFEDGMTAWTTNSGDARVPNYTPNAFIGHRYSVLEGTDALWQEVSVPNDAKNVALVFRLLVRDSTLAGETLRVQVQNAAGNSLNTLATYDFETPTDTRNWINKGFLRQEFDLSAYAGSTVRVAFLNTTASGKYRFVIDQVVMTYETNVTLGLPAVEVSEWDDTVSYTLPSITGLVPQEIDRVDWYIDSAFVGAGPIGTNKWYGAYFLSSLTPGMHWVGGVVRGHDNSILAISQGVWFEVGVPYFELLTNGGFESGAWDLSYSDPPPKIQVVPNVSHPVQSFQDAKALAMGGQGMDDTTNAGQAVQMPHQMASLTLSVRVRPVSEEVIVDDTPEDDDSLWIELWDLSSFTKLGEFMVAHFTDQPSWQGTDHYWRGYVRKEVSIPPGLVAGKNVLVRLFTKETSTLPTTFYVDNASLRYTQWGVQFGE